MGQVRITYRVESGTPETLRKKLFTYLGSGGDPLNLPPVLSCFKYEGDGFFGYIKPVPNRSGRSSARGAPLVDVLPDYDATKRLAINAIRRSANFITANNSNNLIPSTGAGRFGFAGDLADYQSKMSEVAAWLGQFTPYAETFAKVLELYMQSSQEKYPFFGLVAEGRLQDGFMPFAEVIVFGSALRVKPDLSIMFSLHGHPDHVVVEYSNQIRFDSIHVSTPGVGGANRDHSVPFTKYKPGFEPNQVQFDSSSERIETEPIGIVQARVQYITAELARNTILRTPEEIVAEILRIKRRW